MTPKRVLRVERRDDTEVAMLATRAELQMEAARRDVLRKCNASAVAEARVRGRPALRPIALPSESRNGAVLGLSAERPNPGGSDGKECRAGGAGGGVNGATRTDEDVSAGVCKGAAPWLG